MPDINLLVAAALLISTIYGVVDVDIVAAPWLTFMVQCGSFGLLTYIIAILGPKQLTEYRDSQDRFLEYFRRLTDDQQVRFQTALQELQLRFQERNQILVTSLQRNREMIEQLIKENVDLVKSIKEQTKSLADHSDSNTIKTAQALKDAVIEVAKYMGGTQSGP